MSVVVRVLRGSSPSLIDAARSAMVVVTVVYLMYGPVVTGFGTQGIPASGPPLVALGAGLAIVGVQLRHSLAAARGERPRGAVLSFLALLALVYLPLRWFSYEEWLQTQAAVIASVAMLLPGRLGVAAVLGIIVGTEAVEALVPAGRPIGTVAYSVGYGTVYWLESWVALYGSARLVRLLADLGAARTELADLAIARERLRISRDLHDLLGQSLSAVSLKSDLAIRLLRGDPDAARTEIEGMAAVAGDAIRGLGAVTRDDSALSLRDEVDGAAGLLASAGVAARVAVSVPAALAPGVERLLAWSVREGVTNVLRHSAARTCSITAGGGQGGAFVEIVNDGVSGAMGEGSGLAGMAERARAVGGSVLAGRIGEGRFRLRIEAPAGGGRSGSAG